MQLPLAYLDASAIEEIPLEVWSDLFERVGWPGSVRPDRFDHDSIRDSLQRDEPSDQLLLALEAIHSLGTGEGREALLEAVGDRCVAVERLPSDCGDREFAARLFVLQLSESDVSDAFVRAQIRIHAAGQHATINEFRGIEAKPIASAKTARRSLENLVLSHCAENDLGDHVQVDAFEDDGCHVFQVIHSDRTKKPIAIVEGNSARSMIQFRPVHCDLIRYDAVSGRLQIAAKRAGMVRQYVRLSGEAFFGDPAFFDGEAACTLAPLQERGRAALDAHEVPGVGRVRMTECAWERGDRNVHRMRSKDCFKDIDDLDLPVKTEGTLIEAKLKIDVAQKGSRPVSVVIRIPSKVKVSNTRHEPLVYRYLQAVGIRSRSVPKGPLDLWSLHPWRHPTAVWRAALGDRVDDFVREGVLEAVTLDSVRSPDAPDAGSVLEVHPVDENESYGVSVEPEITSRSLSPTDLDGLELNPDKLRGFLRSKMGTADDLRSSGVNGVVDLGTVRIGDFDFRPFYLICTPRQGIGDRLRRAAGGARVVVLVPQGRTTGSELAEAELECAVPSKAEVERRLVLASGLKDQLPAIHHAPAGSRLVVDTQRGTVWVDSVIVDGLKDDTQPFNFVLELARACPYGIPSAELSQRIASGRDDETTAARQAKRVAKKAIAEALANAGKEPLEDPFPNLSKSYRCTLPTYVA